mmetsp:Transcript_18056/g.13000  ORF Transcript_18056/g.13000 Transcript_18056/m.13000 type:complete len:134 (-) Transcript_18056:351-752(-)
MALEGLHRADIIYKDLKASHVFIAPNLKVTLIDLGLSEMVLSEHTSTPAGTFHAMSPEMLHLYLKTKKKEELNYFVDRVTFETDLYSLGILLFEIINGSLPFGYFDRESMDLEVYADKVKQGIPEQYLQAKLG